MEPESASVPLLGEAHFENSQISALESASVPDADTVKNTHNTYKTQGEAAVSSSDVLKSLLGSDFCHICGAVLQFESQRVSHYEGKKHAQKVRLYLQTKRHEEGMNSELTVFQKDGSVDRDRFCQLCNMVFSAPVVAKSHYEGKVHAKNLRKLGIHPTAPATPQSGDPAPQGSPLAPSSQEEGEKEEKEEVEEDEGRVAAVAAAAPAEGVDLSDPGKHCRLCAASFNNPLMARQHYSGRKHQRNQARRRALQQLAEQGQPGAHLASLTFCCPVCNKTFCSVEMYQAHMQGNKHQQKEMKVADMMCKSQRKVYDSFQDELADYIQVQKARGLEPRTQRAAERGEGREEEEEGGDEGEEEEREGPREEGEAFGGLAGPALGAAAPPPALFHPPSWCPPFPPPAPRPRYGPRAPEGPPWGRGFPPMAPPFTAAGVGAGSRSRACRRGAGGHGGFGRGRPRRRRGSRERSSSSSSSSSSSYSSSSSTSSSSSSSDGHSRRERRRKRVRKERGKRAKDQDSEEDEKRRERRARPQGRKSRRSGEKRREEGPRAKRRREAEEEVGGAQATERGEEPPAGETKERAKAEKGPGREGKHKHHKEKKRTKEKTGETDTRTEEERLWDESILGLV